MVSVDEEGVADEKDGIFYTPTSWPSNGVDLNLVDRWISQAIQEMFCWH